MPVYEVLLWSVVANTIFAVLLWCAQQVRYLIQIKIHFNNEIFNVYPKVKTGKGPLKFQVQCFTSKNVIKFNQIEGENKMTAIFHLNLIDLKFGDGYVVHENFGFAFSKLTIKDNKTFYSEQPYIQGDKDYYVAYIWEKVDKL